MLGTRTLIFICLFIFVLSLNCICIIWAFLPCDICKWDGHTMKPNSEQHTSYNVFLYYMARSHHSLQIGENHTVPNIIIAAEKGCSTSYTSKTIVNLEQKQLKLTIFAGWTRYECSSRNSRQILQLQKHTKKENWYWTLLFSTFMYFVVTSPHAGSGLFRLLSFAY